MVEFSYVITNAVVLPGTEYIRKRNLGWGYYDLKKIIMKSALGEKLIMSHLKFGFSYARFVLILLLPGLWFILSGLRAQIYLFSLLRSDS